MLEAATVIADVWLSMYFALTSAQSIFFQCEDCPDGVSLSFAKAAAYFPEVTHLLLDHFKSPRGAITIGKRTSCMSSVHLHPHSRICRNGIEGNGNPPQARAKPLPLHRLWKSSCDVAPLPASLLFVTRLVHHMEQEIKRSQKWCSQALSIIPALSQRHFREDHQRDQRLQAPALTLWRKSCTRNTDTLEENLAPRRDGPT